MKYPATERKWVRQVLARLTPEEREEYERRCATAGRHPSTGRLYDKQRGQIAEEVMQEFRRMGP